MENAIETEVETLVIKPELLPFQVELRLCCTVAGMPSKLRERLPYKQSHKPMRGLMHVVVPSSDLQLIDDLAVADLLSHKDRNSVIMIVRVPEYDSLPAWVRVHDVPRKVPSMAQWLCDRYIKSIMDARKRQIVGADAPLFVHELEAQTAKRAADAEAAELAHYRRAAQIADDLAALLSTGHVIALQRALNIRTALLLDSLEAIIKEMQS